METPARPHGENDARRPRLGPAGALLLALASGTLATRSDARPPGEDGARPDAPLSTALERTALEGAVSKSVTLMQDSMDTWAQEASCVSCHHQALGSMAVSLARERGFEIDEASLEAQVQRMSLQSVPAYAAVLQGEFAINPSFGLSYMLLGRAAAGFPRDDGTDALAYDLLGHPSDRGAFLSESYRPPLEASPVTATALASRALVLFGPEGRSASTARTLRNARSWLEAVTPRSNEERVMRLLGLSWTGAGRGAIDAAAADLARDQREDGGWAQLPALRSDAYATGQALVALQQFGGLPTESEAFQRGLRFLLRTQQDDGSWRVETRRRMPGLPYFETGFPHGMHQFVSFAGTAWATMALCVAIDPRPSSVFHGPRPPRDPDASLAEEAEMLPVHRAAAFGTVDDLRRALDAAPDTLDARAAGGTTPLMLSVHDAEKVELLLARGADPRVATSSGLTALGLAGGYSGAADSLALLLDGDAPPEPSALDHALVRAARTGERSKVALLLDRGADLESVDPEGMTALLRAAVSGQLDLLRLLLERGASLEPAGGFAATPLHFAALAGWTALVEELVQRGVDLDATDPTGMTALAWAAKVGHGRREIVSVLLEAGADPSIAAENGRTPRDWAEHFGNDEVLELLEDDERAP